MPLWAHRRAWSNTSLLLAGVLLFIAGDVFAHDVAASDRAFIAQNAGEHVAVYLYLGAKHMVTGYDHIAFLFGVVFLLANIRHVVLYVSCFALGHTVTLLAGVVAEVQINAYLVDAVIGLSVVYKGIDNLTEPRWRWHEFVTRALVFGFGLVHGLGLATKLLQIEPSEDGLLLNLLAFNVGVEIGQLIALCGLLSLLVLLERLDIRHRVRTSVNVGLLVLGFGFFWLQLGMYLYAPTLGLL